MSPPPSKPLDLGISKLGLDNIAVPKLKLKPRPSSPPSIKRKKPNPWPGVLLKMAPLALLVAGGIWIAGPVYRFLRNPAAIWKTYLTNEEMKKIADCLLANFPAAEDCPNDLRQALANFYRDTGDPYQDAWEHEYFFVVHKGDNSFTLISGGPDGKLPVLDLFRSVGAVGVDYSQAEMNNNITNTMPGGGQDDLRMQRSWAR